MANPLNSYPHLNPSQFMNPSPGNRTTASVMLNQQYATAWLQHYGLRRIDMLPDPAYDQKPIETVNSDQPLTGFRAWKLKRDDKAYLQSTYKMTVWPHRQPFVRGGITKTMVPEDEGTPSISNPAGIRIPAHEAINDLSKGIHAVKEKHKLGQLCVEYENARISGEIYMWGEVTETENGFLAQYAYPKKLFVLSDMDPTVMMELEDNYGVPVIVDESIEMAYRSSCDWRKKQRELEHHIMYRSYNIYDPQISNELKRLQDEISQLNRMLTEEKMKSYYYATNQHMPWLEYKDVRKL